MIHSIFQRFGVDYHPDAPQGACTRRTLAALGLGFSLAWAAGNAYAIDVLAGLPSAAATASNPALVQTEQVRAELLLDAPDGWQAGKTVRLAIDYALDPEHGIEFKFVAGRLRAVAGIATT